MFRYDAFITLDYKKVLPACRLGFYQWYISIQQRNLWTIWAPYWVLGRHPDIDVVEVGGNGVWSSLLFWRGNKHVGEWIEGDARIEGEKRLSGGESKWKSIFFQVADPGIRPSWARTTGADLGIYFGGPNQILQSKVEGEARSNRGRDRSARESRAKPESKARSAWELRAKPESRMKPEKKRRRGLGRGLGEPLPRKFLKNETWNHSFWCIFEANFWNKWI